MEYIPCIGNSSYSFWRILLKLHSCFQDGLKICILFSQDPEIIFFCILTQTFFQAFMLQICIGSICLVSATPPTVLGQSFWNFTGTLQLSFDFTWEICHLLDITAVAGHLAWLAVLLCYDKGNEKSLVIWSFWKPLKRLLGTISPISCMLSFL